MATLTNTAIRFMLDNVFNYVPEEASNDAEYWWTPTHNRDGWIVAWIDDLGRLDTVHSDRYPPDVWGGVGPWG